MPKPTCFICDKPLGSTFINALRYPGTVTAVPEMCVRCGGRVHGLILGNREPLIAILKDVQWASGDDLHGDSCPECGAPRDNETTGEPTHVHDCRLAIAIGATRYSPPKE